MNFEVAIGLLRLGVRLCRKGWNGKNMYVELQRPDAHSKMTQPYLYLKTAQGDFIPWTVSQADLFAEDWENFTYPSEA